MSDEEAESGSEVVEDKPRKRSGCLVGCLLFTPIAYALSPLPYFFLAVQLSNFGWSDSSYLMVDVAESLYSPLIWLGDKVEPIGDFYNWYIGLLDPYILGVR